MRRKLLHLLLLFWLHILLDLYNWRGEKNFIRLGLFARDLEMSRCRSASGGNSSVGALLVPDSAPPQLRQVNCRGMFFDDCGCCCCNDELQQACSEACGNKLELVC